MKKAKLLLSLVKAESRTSPFAARGMRYASNKCQVASSFPLI